MRAISNSRGREVEPIRPVPITDPEILARRIEQLEADVADIRRANEIGDLYRPILLPEVSRLIGYAQGTIQKWIKDPRWAEHVRLVGGLEGDGCLLVRGVSGRYESTKHRVGIWKRWVHFEMRRGRLRLVRPRRAGAEQ